MNKVYYNFGNPFKLKFREHYCYKCDANLLIHMHHKIVSQKSDESKYYDFSIPCDGGNMVGSCEFVHKVRHHIQHFRETILILDIDKLGCSILND